MPAAPPRTADDAAGPSSDGVGGGPAAGPLRPEHVTPTTLGDVIDRVREVVPGNATVAAGTTSVRVSGATLRAHEVRAGDLFAALPGTRAHGADFADAALARGAVAVLTDADGAARPSLVRAADEGVAVIVHADPRAAIGPAAARIYGDPSTRLGVLGVTGTSGKTTTVYLLEAALAAAGASTGLIGTVETRAGGQRLPSAFTTPEAPDLQALLAVMVEGGVSHVAIEVSSHALALGRVAGTGFAVGAFANLSQDHLDFHPDMEGYFAVKARLFDGRSAAEVVCVDSPWGRRLVTDTTVTVSGEPGRAATWSPSEVSQRPDGTQTFVAHGPDGWALPVTLRLPGGFNVTNALLALACGCAAGLDPAALADGLSRVQVPGRMQRVDAGQPFLAVVDYAHKPAAVRALLETLRAGTEGRVLTVVGCGGDRDRAKRPVMGRIAAELSDRVWVTDDNPRAEDPAEIRAAVLEGARDVAGHGDDRVSELGDRREAIAAAVASARPGDVVVVAGKGHETGQKVGAVTLPFSDVDELERAITTRPGTIA